MLVKIIRRKMFKQHFCREFQHMASPIVEISEGQLRGTFLNDLDGNRFHAFLGIPYAKPPVGDLRFKPPESIESWSDIKLVTKNADKCIQKDSVAKGSENCLHLNVFTKQLPDKKSELKPVIVYIHGGKFQQGCNNTNLYGPEFLLTQDIVLVIPNYRLGILGFLKLEDPSLQVLGNAGLKDQNLALHWIQRNIEKFNGDPNNVTIFGHSAGSMSTHYHLLSSSSKGLFHKAILFSGTVFWTWAERDEFSLKKFANLLNIETKSEGEIVKTLKTLPAEVIVEAQDRYLKLYGDRNLIFGPVVEQPNSTAFLTRDPTDMILNGEFSNVPILAGYTSHEGLLFEITDRCRKASGIIISSAVPKPEDIIPSKMRAKMDEKTFEAICSEMEKIYCIENSLLKRCLLRSDLHFIAPTIAAAKTHAALSPTPVYLMRWSVDDELNVMKKISNICELPGTCHGDELGYIFRNTLLPLPAKDSNADRTIRKAVRLIKNFCTFGNPTPDKKEFGLVWAPLQENETCCIDVGTEITLKCNPEQRRMKFWQRILDIDRRSGHITSLKI